MQKKLTSSHIYFLQFRAPQTAHWKIEHITPVLNSLHWLYVCQRIGLLLKIILVHKTLNCLGPKYISYLLECYETPRPLKSSGTGLLTVPRIRSKVKQLLVSMLYLWNKLPEYLRTAKTLSSLKSGLKTFFTADFQ